MSGHQDSRRPEGRSTPARRLSPRWAMLGHAGLCPGVDGLAWSLEAPWGERGPGLRRRRPAVSGKGQVRMEGVCSFTRRLRNGGTEPAFLSLGK